MNDVGKELYEELRANLLKLGVDSEPFDELEDTDKTAWHWLGETVTRKGYESTL
jgi:hypothetical protein